MSQITQLVAKVCEQQHVRYSFASDNDALLMIHFPTHTHYIHNASIGLNPDSIASLCKDKYYTYQLLKDSVNCPQTFAYIDPNCSPVFAKYRTFEHIDSILADIGQHSSMPVIIKRNHGLQGNHVYLCHTNADIVTALENIYYPAQPNYDHVALACQYIPPVSEYRVIVYQHRLQFAYRKDIAKASFTGNLSPLHQAGSRAVLITDPELIAKLQVVIDQITPKLPLNYAGIDIIEDKTGQLWLIEINTSPGYHHFLTHNPKTVLIQMFTRIITDLGSLKTT